MNKEIAAAIATASMLMGTAALADAKSDAQNQKIEMGIRLIKLACGTGVSSQQLAVGGKIGGEVTLKRLAGAQANAGVSFSHTEAQGLAAALSKEVNSSTTDLSKAQIACMQPYVRILFAQLFPTVSEPAKTHAASKPVPRRAPEAQTRAPIVNFQAPPTWRRQPTQEEMSRFFPKAAIGTATGGSALLKCKIAISGLTYGCAVQSEEPAGLGFGEAALQVSHLFELNPAIVNGAAIDGSEVQIPIQFKAPPKVTQATFKHKPDWYEVVADYPELAALQGRGAMTLTCSLADDGTVYGCVAHGHGSEDPVLVQGALKMSRLFKFNPPLRDGKPDYSSKLNIPIIFGTVSGGPGS